MQDFAKFVQVAPYDPYSHVLYASYLSTCRDHSLRDGNLALEHATRACEMTEWQEMDSLRALAAAHFQLHNLDDAVRWCEKALEHAAPHEYASVRNQLDYYRRKLSDQQ